MGKNLIFVFGAARSGTTWLAKIFNSHPDVLYWHEPDMVLLENRIPGLCAIDEVPRYRDQAQIYLEWLMTVRNLKNSWIVSDVSQALQPTIRISIAQNDGIGTPRIGVCNGWSAMAARCSNSRFDPTGTTATHRD